MANAWPSSAHIWYYMNRYVILNEFIDEVFHVNNQLYLSHNNSQIFWNAKRVIIFLSQYNHYYKTVLFFFLSNVQKNGQHISRGFEFVIWAWLFCLLWNLSTFGSPSPFTQLSLLYILATWFFFTFCFVVIDPISHCKTRWYIWMINDWINCTFCNTGYTPST